MKGRVLAVSIVRIGALWIDETLNWKTAIARNLFERDKAKI